MPYLDYLAPGILAQSVLFISIFYGIQIIWERDAGVLAKLMARPRRAGRWSPERRSRPACARSCRCVVVLVLAARPRRRADRRTRCDSSAWPSWSCSRPAFFSTLSMMLAGIVLSRERLMGIGQTITMPLFFASNALYPVAIMPGGCGAQPR